MVDFWATCKSTTRFLTVWEAVRSLQPAFLTLSFACLVVDLLTGQPHSQASLCLPMLPFRLGPVLLRFRVWPLQTHRPYHGLGGTGGWST